jgi:hypothetical protein
VSIKLASKHFSSVKKEGWTQEFESSLFIGVWQIQTEQICKLGRGQAERAPLKVLKHSTLN